jgi:hypothetical protein
MFIAGGDNGDYLLNKGMAFVMSVASTDAPIEARHCQHKPLLKTGVWRHFIEFHCLQHTAYHMNVCLPTRLVMPVPAPSSSTSNGERGFKLLSQVGNHAWPFIKMRSTTISFSSVFKGGTIETDNTQRAHLLAAKKTSGENVHILRHASVEI